MKKITMAVLLGSLGTLQLASAAVSFTGKEVGVLFVSETRSSNPTQSKLLKPGTTIRTFVLGEEAMVTISNSEISVGLETVENPIISPTALRSASAEIAAITSTPTENLIEGKEVGVQFISGTTASAPTESKIYKQGTTISTPVFGEKATVTMSASEIVIDFGLVSNPIIFSSEDFSGLRFYDVSQLDFMDNDPSVALDSLAGSALNFTLGNTSVMEADGAMFSQSRLTVDENNIYVNFSGLTITQATGTKVVISLAQVAPEPSSTMFIGLAGMVFGLRRRR